MSSVAAKCTEGTRAPEECFKISSQRMSKCTWQFMKLEEACLFGY